MLQDEHLNALLDFVAGRPSAYLDEMAWYLFDEFSIVCDEATIWRNLHRLWWSRKKSYKIARERDQRLRDDWALRPAGWEAHQLVYIDESAGNERTGDRKYAWGPVGMSCRHAYVFGTEPEAEQALEHSACLFDRWLHHLHDTPWQRHRRDILRFYTKSGPSFVPHRRCWPTQRTRHG